MRRCRARFCHPTHQWHHQADRELQPVALSSGSLVVSGMGPAYLLKPSTKGQQGVCVITHTFSPFTHPTSGQASERHELELLRESPPSVPIEHQLAAVRLFELTGDGVMGSATLRRGVRHRPCAVVNSDAAPLTSLM
jgi:hypothetical protein